MGAFTDLYDTCEELLVVCADAVKPTPGGPFTRAYVSPGPPAWDCEQLTVHSVGPAIGDTQPLQPPLQTLHRVSTTGFVNLVTLIVTPLRCVTTIGKNGEIPIAPPAVSLVADADKLYADLWAIVNTVKSRYRQGTLFSPVGCAKREFTLDPTVVLNTQGGLMGWQIQYRVQLDGYEVP